MIGLTLGIATQEFQTLLIAVSVHLFFEGVALGVRIADMKQISFMKRILIIVLYPLSTPIGIVLGILCRQLLFKEPVVALLSQGILDSLAAGVLFYSAYVELIAGEMNARESYLKSQPGWKQFLLLIAVYTGSAIMTIIGIWA